MDELTRSRIDLGLLGRIVQGHPEMTVESAQVLPHRLDVTFAEQDPALKRHRIVAVFWGVDRDGDVLRPRGQGRVHRSRSNDAWLVRSVGFKLVEFDGFILSHDTLSGGTSRPRRTYTSFSIRRRNHKFRRRSKGRIVILEQDRIVRSSDGLLSTKVWKLSELMISRLSMLTTT